MAVADDKRKFIDVCVGWPGSCHDSRIFKNSSLGKKLESEQFRMAHLPNDSYILGDSAFQLQTYLMTPFRESQLRAEGPGQADIASKRHYNRKMSSARVVVEHAFGLLKGRFRRLTYLETKSIKKAVDLTTVSCILHNICIQHDDQWENEQDIEPDAVQADGDDPAAHAQDQMAAVRKRLALVEEMWQNR